jgi:hypothetical protein
VSLPIRFETRLVGFLTVIAADDLADHDVRLIEAHADLLALALSAVSPRAETAAHVLDEEAERAEVAAVLREGPLASLVAARYALDTGSERSAVRAVVQQALRELRRVVVAQRAGGVDGDLARGLRGLVEDLRHSGCRVDLLIADLPAGSVPPSAAVTAYRVVAAALNGVSGRPSVIVTGDVAAECLIVSVTGARDPHDAGALDRWARRARALGGSLERHPDGVVLRLPCRLPALTSSGATR